jgi:hypothetical protein
MKRSLFYAALLSIALYGTLVLRDGADTCEAHRANIFYHANRDYVRLYQWRSQRFVVFADSPQSGMGSHPARSSRAGNQEREGEVDGT